MSDPRALLAEIRSRTDKATPGPWKLWGMSVQTDRSGTGETNYDEMVARTSDPDHGLRTFNASFIAQARQDVPRLVAALQAALDECDAQEGRSERAAARRAGRSIREAIATALDCP